MLIQTEHLIAIYAAALACFLLEKTPGKKFFVRSGFVLLAAGLLGHGAMIVHRGLSARRFPLTDTYETLLLFAWIILLIGVLLYSKYRFRRIKVVAALMSILVLSFSLLIVSDIRPLMPSLRSGWLYFHVGSYFIAYSTFAISFGLSVIYFAVYFFRRSTPKRQAFKTSLEGLIFRVLDTGFPFLTMGLAGGMIWASISWGRFWNWDAKEVWALVTWLVYAGCLHLRHARNLQGFYAPVLAALGFIAILFTYIGVNLFFDSLHSYA